MSMGWMMQVASMPEAPPLTKGLTVFHTPVALGTGTAGASFAAMAAASLLLLLLLLLMLLLSARRYSVPLLPREGAAGTATVACGRLVDSQLRAGAAAEVHPCDQNVPQR
jgi:uncharacterized protein (DUF58 family)